MADELEEMNFKFYLILFNCNHLNLNGHLRLVATVLNSTNLRDAGDVPSLLGLAGRDTG